MSNTKYLIFGGGGFIGTHLAKFIADSNVPKQNIFNLDINEKRNNDSTYLQTDVRKSIKLNIDELQPAVIFNLAAIHTTPGHPDNDYFETNILGAENVCQFARDNSINIIIFTSSIAPYGVSEDIKSETTLPTPSTPYGISKLSAEYIHKVWQAEDAKNRKLIILRPGVVFGKNENGNFTRLYNSIKKGFFFYPGRKDTIKAAVYVKDVVRILYETATNDEPGINTLNLTYSPAPTIEEICNTIAKVTAVSPPKLVVSAGLLTFAANLLFSTAKVLGKGISGIHPDRIKKLFISTNISGTKLQNSKYRLQYNLENAINDWFNECDKKGLE